jgi:serine/threonine protein kinase
MELLHQSGEIIASRYRILEILGQGGVGITYKAIDLQSSQIVALKALSLRRMKDWKVLELFEREAHILAQLNHPAIPRYLDYFQVETEQDRSFYIAQQLAEGKSLVDWVEKGWHPTEAQVRHLAIQVLEILVYLHSFTPPVIHRDIKPQNIILNSTHQSPLFKGGKGGSNEGWGDLFLVDFGAVQDTYHNTLTGGSTVVGTYGYMAPEQFRGQAVLSTDLYGLGTTLLYLLTGQSTADLPQRQLRIDFRSQVRLSKDFADWLERMIEPLIEDRFLDAKEALAVLQGERVLAPKRTHKPRRPLNTPITLTHLENQLLIKIPPVWSRSPASLMFTFLPYLGVHLL